MSESSPTVVSSSLTPPRRELLLPASGEWIHDSDFWFPDGDVVLGVQSIAAGPQTVHLFRVHKPVLELHSSVFRKTLSGDTDSNFDGARAIWVPQTSPRFLRYFLRLLYNP